MKLNLEETTKQNKCMICGKKTIPYKNTTVQSCYCQEHTPQKPIKRFECKYCKKKHYHYYTFCKGKNKMYGSGRDWVFIAGKRKKNYTKGEKQWN